MAYTDPTVEDFQTRFPEFEDIDEDVITIALTDAKRHVDDSWTEGDYATAIMLLAAHFLQTSEGAYDTGGLRSFSLGAISVTYADRAKGFDPSITSYGSRFMDLLIANKRGIRVA